VDALAPLPLESNLTPSVVPRAAMLLPRFISVKWSVPSNGDEVDVVVDDHGHEDHPQCILEQNDGNVVSPNGIANNQPKNKK
jgi:hypothetical protein